MNEQEITAPVEIDMWSQQLTYPQQCLRRRIISDLPDAEVEAYGTPDQIHNAFDGDCDDLSKEEKQESKTFCESVDEEAILTGYNTFYWDLNAQMYIILF